MASLAITLIPLSSAQASALATPTISSISTYGEGFSFYINNYSSTATYSVSTTNGFAVLGQPSNSTDLGVIEYGLAAGASATLTITATQSGYTNGILTVTSSTSAASTSACSTSSTTTSGYVTVAITSTSQTSDCVTNWTVPAGVTTAEVAVVGGGGGAGYYGNASAGGAGALLDNPSYSLTPGASIPITVGAGGPGISNGNYTSNGTSGPGVNGDNTVFNSIIASGGGGGGGGDAGKLIFLRNGLSGGSGGSATSEGGSGTGGSSNAASVCGCTSSGWSAYGSSGGTASGGYGGGAGGLATGKTLSNFSSYTLAVGGGSSSPVSNTGSGGRVTGSVSTSGGTAGIVLIYYPVPSTIVSFNANNGTGSPSVASVTQASAGASVTLATVGTLARSGFTFAGWNTSSDGTGTFYGAGTSYTPASSITLYAQWNSTITFNANNSGSSNATSSWTSVLAPPSQTVTTTAATTTLPVGNGLTNNNYSFGGWNTAANGSGTSYAGVNNDLQGIPAPQEWLRGNSFNFTTGVWTAAAGNNISDRNGANTTHVSSATESAGDGSSATFSYVKGDTSSGFTIGSINTGQFTLCAVERMTSIVGESLGTANSPVGRILQTDAGNWLSGYWGGYMKSYYHNGWNSNGYGVAADTNWHLNCDRPSNSYWDGLRADNGSGGGYGATFSANLAINMNGNYPAESSNWGIADLMLFNTTLSDTQIVQIEKYYASTFGLNTLTSNLSTNLTPINTTSSSTTYQSSGSTTLYAQWNSTVTFNGNSQTSGTAPTALTTATSVVLPTNTGSLAKTGYVFDGWYTTTTGTGGTYYKPGASYTPTGNITLYADWVSAPVISGSTSYTFVVGQSSRSDTHTASGGVSPYSFALSTAMPGIGIDTSTVGGFALTVSSAVNTGTYSATITLTDGGGLTTTQTLSITVTTVLRFGVNSASYSLTFGQPTSVTIGSTGGSSSKSISISALTAPVSNYVSLNNSSFASTGIATLTVLAGLPVGTYVETATGTDGATTAAEVITIVINPLPFITYPTTGSVPTLASGMSVYYDFSNTSSYSGSGTTVTDLSGNSNNSTITGTPTYSYNTTSGGQIGLTGTQYLSTGTMTGLGNSGPYSEFAWVYPTGNSDIFDLCDNTACNNYHTTEMEYYNNKFYFAAYNKTTIASGTYAANNWYYVGFVFDGTSETAYVNGVMVGTPVATGTRYAPATEVIGIGRPDSTALAVASTYGHFSLGAFHFWRLALNSATVTNNFLATEAKYLGTQYIDTANINPVTVYTTAGVSNSFGVYYAQGGTSGKTITQSLSPSTTAITLDTSTANTARINISSAISSTNSTTAATYVSTLTATDGNSVSGTYLTNIVVNPAINLTPSTTTLNVTGGTSAAATVSAQYGTGGYAFSLAVSPASSAITLSNSGSVATISVGPSATPGTYTATLTATDSVTATASQNISIVISTPVSIVGSTGSSVSTTVTKASSLVLNVLNGTGTRTISIVNTGTTNCPSAITLSSYSLIASASTTTLTIPGSVPVGTYQCQVKATDANAAYAQTTISITVNPWPSFGVNSGLLLDYDAGISASYPGTGSTWANLGSAGSSENATFTGTPTYSTSNGYGTLTFNSGNTSFNGTAFATLPNPGVLTTYTASVWAYPTAIPGGGNAPAFIGEAYGGTGTKINYAIYMQSGQVCAGYFTGSTWILAGTGGNTCYAVSANAWYNFTFTVAQSGSNYVLSLYQATLTSAPLLLGSYTTGTAPATQGNSIYIARRWDNPDTIAGQVPQVLLYNRALTSSEILQNYNASVIRFANTGTTAGNTLTMTQGVPASITGTVNPGSAPFSFSTSTPAGVSISATSNTSFTLNYDATVAAANSTTARVFTQTVTASDSVTASSSTTYQVTVNPPVLISVGALTPSGTAGIAITDTVTATQGTGTKTFAMLPQINGITLTSTGTNTASIATATTLSPGTYTETVTATDTLGATASTPVTITVNPGPVISGPIALAGTTGAALSSAPYLVANGTGSYTFGLNPGLTGVSVSSISSNSFKVLIASAGPSAGTYNETLTVTDGSGAVGNYLITITMVAPVTLSGSTTLTKTYGSPLVQGYSTSGGTSPFTFGASSSSTNGATNPCISVISTNSGYTVEKIQGYNPSAANCYWTVPSGVTSINYAIVGGGGGGGAGEGASGGWGGGGGGGGGKVVTGTGVTVSPGTAISVLVGSGGAAGSYTPNAGSYTSGTHYSGTSGGSSSFNGTSAAGGSYGATAGATGAGGSSTLTSGSENTMSGRGGASGSGNAGGCNDWDGAGGGAGDSAGDNSCLFPPTTANSTALTGNDLPGDGAIGGAGGAGTSVSISGFSATLGGGGGGGGSITDGAANSTPVRSIAAGTSKGDGGLGGTGGGGNAELVSGSTVASPGTRNTGGGGGGGGYTASTSTLAGARGGDGVVVITYATPAASTQTNVMSWTVNNTSGGTNALSLNVPEYVPVGTYSQTIAAYGADAAESSGGSMTVTITVQKATPQVVLALPGAVTSIPYGFGVTLSATTNETGTVTFANGGTTLCSSVNATPTAPATCRWTPSGPATASLTATLLPSDQSDYNTGVGSLSVTVTKAPALTITANSETFTFNNSQQGSKGYTVTGLSELDSISSVAITYSTTGATRPTNAGTYTVTPSALVGSAGINTTNYMAINYVTGVLTINKAPLSGLLSYGDTSTATVVYLASGTYSPILTNPSDGSSTYTSDNTAICSVNSTTGALTTAAIGSCNITLAVGAGTNFLAGSITRTITVNRAPRVFTLTPSVSTLKYGDTATVTVSITPDATQGVISYTLQPTSACTFDPVGLVVTATSATGSCLITGTITQGDDYLAATSSAPTFIFHTAVAPQITYQSIPSVSFINSSTHVTFSLVPVITGLKFNDTLGSLTPLYTGTGSTSYGPNSATPPIHGGTYTVTPSAYTLSVGLTANYDTPTYTGVSATVLKISQLALTDVQSVSTINTPFQLAPNGGSSANTITYSIVNGGTASGCSVSTSGVLNATSQGTCILLITMPGNSDYNDVTLQITVSVANFVNFEVSAVPSGGGGSIALSPPPTQVIASDPACTNDCAPLLTGISESTGLMGDLITLTGQYFTGATLVRFGRTAITNITVLSDTSVVFQIPTGISLGTYAIKVQTPYGLSVPQTIVITG